MGSIVISDKFNPAAGRGFFMMDFKIGDRVKFKDAAGEGQEDHRFPNPARRLWF